MMHGPTNIKFGTV